MIVLVWIACTNAGGPVAQVAPPPVTQVAPPPVAQAAPPPVAARPAILTPATVYASCRDRVEGEGVAGECTKDEDCAKAGCSGEVCVARARAAEVMTACDVLDCFSVLDTCRCSEGTCTWSLTADGLLKPTP